MNAGTKTPPLHPEASKAAESPAVALDAEMHISPWRPKDFSISLSRRRASGPKLVNQPE